MKAGILVFPGSNCDKDLGQILEREFYTTVEYLWHGQPFDVTHDIYFIPGGFAYGDYLRSGALAARSSSIASLKQAVNKGRMTVGICNGFQILTESHLLPGALIRNVSLKYICQNVDLVGENLFSGTPSKYYLPISHGEGNYICDGDTLQQLEGEGRVLFRYTDNPNGATADIAGISDAQKRVLGLMPHPERAILPNFDDNRSQLAYGRFFFERLFSLL